ncbi:MAG: hypothetical protein AABX65_04545, partial [Nanoarchaeota archaeon]
MLKREGLLVVFLISFIIFFKWGIVEGQSQAVGLSAVLNSVQAWIGGGISLPELNSRINSWITETQTQDKPTCDFYPDERCKARSCDSYPEFKFPPYKCWTSRAECSGADSFSKDIDGEEKYCTGYCTMSECGDCLVGGPDLCEPPGKWMAYFELGAKWEYGNKGQLAYCRKKGTKDKDGKE